MSYLRTPYQEQEIGIMSDRNGGKLKAVQSELPEILSIEAKKFVLLMNMAEKDCRRFYPRIYC